MTNFAGVINAPVFDGEALESVVSLDTRLQSAVEAENSAEVRALLELLSPVWSVASIDSMQAVIDQIEAAGVSDMTQQLLVAAAYKKAAREAEDGHEQDLYETFGLLALDRAGAHRSMIK
jgi:hypothetical protein